MPQTLAQADELSRRRARAGRIRTTVVFVFTVVAFLTLALLLQRQQEMLRIDALAACEQRRANTTKVNDTWDALARAEQANRLVDDRVRIARIRAFENAKLTVPECRG